MHTSIAFPNLGITFSDVGQSVTVFGFTIHYYGMIIGLGFVLAVLLALHHAKITGQNTEHYMDLALYGIVLGIAGARLYYVIFRFEDYKDNLLSVFNLREGGLAIYGGVIAAVLVMVVYTRKKSLNFLQVADTVMPSFILGQILGRWGNFFNREAFGEYTNSLFAMRLPLDAVNSAYVTDLMKENLTVADGVSYIQVHPTFLYESCWNLMVFLILLYVFRHKKYDGQVFLLYLGGYGLGRFMIESLRTDQLLITGTTIPVSQALAGVLTVVSLVFAYILRKRKTEENLEK